MKITFGKYKGRDIDDKEIPPHYLIWMEENVNMPKGAREEINLEIKRRSNDRSSIGKDTGRKI